MSLGLAGKAPRPRLAPGRGSRRAGAAAMKPRVTNVSAGVTSGSPSVSVVEVESTIPACRHALDAPDPLTLRLRLWGLRLNMDPFRRWLLDGVVRWVELLEPEADCVECRIGLELACGDEPPRVQVEGGMPAVTRVVLSRRPLRCVLRGRRVTIDPAHGGRDTGERGPVNLQERHVVLRIASRLAWHLSEGGCRVCLTRQEDRELDASRRVAIALTHRAEVMVSLHTAHTLSRPCRGTRTLVVVPGGGPPQPAACALARSVQLALLERLALPDRGTGAVAGSGPAREAGPGGRLPFVHLWVEPVCLADPLEEALLRSSVFRDRIAQAIRNGLARHWASGAGGGPGYAL